MTGPAPIAIGTATWTGLREGEYSLLQVVGDAEYEGRIPLNAFGDLSIAEPSLKNLSAILIGILFFDAPYAIIYLTVTKGQSHFDYFQIAGSISSAIALAASASACADFRYESRYKEALAIASRFSFTIWTVTLGLETGSGIGDINNGTDFRESAMWLDEVNFILRGAYPTRWSGDSAQLYEEKLNKQQEYVDLIAEADGKITALIRAQAELVDLVRKFIACAAMIASAISLFVTREALRIQILIVLSPTEGRIEAANLLRAVGIISSVLVTAIASCVLCIASEVAELAKKIENTQLDYKAVIHGVKNSILPKNETVITKIPTNPNVTELNFSNITNKPNLTIKKPDPNLFLTHQSDQNIPFIAYTNYPAKTAPTLTRTHISHQETCGPVPTFPRDAPFADRADRSGQQLASRINQHHSTDTAEADTDSYGTPLPGIPTNNATNLGPWQPPPRERHRDLAVDGRVAAR